MSNFSIPVLPLIAAGLLAACSGGSGSSNSGTSTTGSPSSSDGTDGTGTSASFDGDGGSGGSSADEPNGNGAGTPVSGDLSGSGQLARVLDERDLSRPTQGDVTVTINRDDSGDVQRFVAEIADDTGTLDEIVLEGEDFDEDLGDHFKEAEDEDDRVVILRKSNGNDGAYEHQTFGLWVTPPQGQSAPGALTAFSAGAERAEQGWETASYSGEAVGVQTIYSSDADGAYVEADVTIETDTNSAVFKTENSRLYTAESENYPARGAQPGLDLEGEIDIEGGEMSGSVSGDAVRGTMEGRFYGPNAEEAGGTFATNDGSGGEYFGSFGASK